jgi:hypothetical protein
MYEAVRDQLEQRGAAQRGAGWQLRRHLRGVVSTNPAREVVDPTQFGLPARQDVAPRHGDGRSGGSVSAPAGNPAGLAEGQHLPGLLLSVQASVQASSGSGANAINSALSSTVSSSRVLSVVNRFMLGLIVEAAAAAPIELQVTSNEGRSAVRRVLDIVIPHLVSELERRDIDPERLVVVLRPPSRGVAAAHHEVTLAATVASMPAQLNDNNRDWVAEVGRRLRRANLPTAPARILAVSSELAPRLNSSAPMIDAVTSWIRDGDIPTQYRRGGRRVHADWRS